MDGNNKMSQFLEVSEIFKQLADPTRVHIFWLLCHREACVMQIASILDMSSPAISHHLRSLADCGLLTSRREGKEVYYKAADSKAGHLLHKTVEQVMEIACPKPIVNDSSAPEEIVHSIHEYLMQHLPEQITMEDMAKKFLMNTTTLKATFKKVYGVSIASHMKTHRMEYAARLLLDTTDSVAQVAEAVGYTSQSRFSNAFYETYGVLPSEYRRHKTADYTVL